MCAARAAKQGESLYKRKADWPAVNRFAQKPARRIFEEKDAETGSRNFT